jgi:isoquinoline 1-oxidoreductase beta subunit
MARRSAEAGQPIHDDGDVEAALASAAQIVEASYELPYLAHAPMEPMNCTVHVRGSECEIWSPTQSPQSVQRAVGRALNIEPSSVTVHVTLVGGGFGRRLYPDPEIEAALIAKEVDGPVMVVWSREDDIAYCRFRPMSHHVLRGGLDGDGNLTAWQWHIVNTHTGRFDPGDFPAHHVPNYRVEYTHFEGMLPRGAWRSTVNSQNPFVSHSFFDELAAAAGRDPLEWRLQLLQNSPRPDADGDQPYRAARMLRVVEEVGRRSGWSGSKPAGMGRGVAFFHGYGSYVAQVAEVRVSGGEIKVERVYCVADCGQVVNPDLVQAQIEGGICFGLSAVLHQQITLSRGRVQEGNFDDYPLLKISEMPRIEGHIIESTERPGGMGEPPLPPIAAAVANAVFDATGQRLRKLPLSV